MSASEAIIIEFVEREMSACVLESDFGGEGHDDDDRRLIDRRTQTFCVNKFTASSRNDTHVSQLVARQIVCWTGSKAQSKSWTESKWMRGLTLLAKRTFRILNDSARIVFLAN